VQRSESGYTPNMLADDRKRLVELSRLLKTEQTTLLIAAARGGGAPSASTLQRVAQLELNIAAIENTLSDA
jgi:hypothetical protein